MRSISISLVLLSFLVSVAVSAATYKWTDENGNVVYSQTPPGSGQYERIKGLKHSRSSQANEAESKTDTNTSKKVSGNSPEDLARREELKEELKKDNCEKAKKNLDVFTVYRRFKNEDGTVTRMDENERQAKIKEAEAQIREFCN